MWHEVRVVEAMKTSSFTCHHFGCNHYKMHYKHCLQYKHYNVDVKATLIHDEIPCIKTYHDRMQCYLGINDHLGEHENPPRSSPHEPPHVSTDI